MARSDVQLWFAKDELENIVTINEVNKEDNKKYCCPICGSKVNPKQGKINGWHFAHFDKSKCNNESMLHWWFKNKFLVQGDKFIVKSDIEKEYICKEILVEQSYNIGDKVYNPDITIICDSGEIVYFEMENTNKKKIEEYLDIWIELSNIVVEVDIKELVNFKDDKSMTFNALYYNDKCFNVKKSNTYYNTIGKYKEELKQNGEYNKRKIDMEKLDWFWRDVIRYKQGEVDIDYMGDLIDSICGYEKQIVYSILKKSMCSQLFKDYKTYDQKNCIHPFDKAIDKDSVLKKVVNILDRKYRKIDKDYNLELRKEATYYKSASWFRGKKRTTSHVSYYTYLILLFHKSDINNIAIESIDITNKIFEIDVIEELLEYIERGLSKHSISKKCIDCDTIFQLNFEEVKFYSEKGFNNPNRCKECRIKRRNIKYQEELHE